MRTMKNSWMLVAVGLLGVSGVAMGGTEPSPFINYQGVLRNTAATPLDGTFDMVFRFFDAPLGGNEILIDEHLVAPGTGDVTVTGGLFNVALGSGDIFDGSGPGTFASLGDVFRRLSDVYLEVEVGGEILSPRTRVLSAAYSVGDAPTDPPCFDGSNRFVDCGNGTVTDTVTGLIWLKDATCATLPGLGNESGIYQAANEAAASLKDGDCGLTDNSSPGDWRLPTLECPTGFSCTLANATGELASILAPACPAPFILDAAGLGCWSEGDPFSGVQTYVHWSSTAYATNPVLAWRVGLDSGFVGVSFKSTFSFLVWPVRAGP